MESAAIVLISFLLMEPVTALTHRYVMHGFGRVLHRSHHRRGTTGWEANDLYPVMFAAVVLLGLAVGFNVDGWAVLVPIGIGITAYGAAYALVHDVYIHGRLPLFRGRRVAVLERLAQAHQVHHARNGAPYGMLLPIVGDQMSRRSPRTSPGRSTSGSRPSHEPVEA